MAVMKKKGKKEVPAISTASLPDVIFMLLFFFMVSTTMRDQELLVRYRLPEATEVQKLEKKNLVSYINIGEPVPHMQAKYGTATQIQLNDAFASVDAIGEYVEQERESMPERDKPFMRVSMKIDEDTHMGIVTDIKMALREAWALNIVYSGGKRQ